MESARNQSAVWLAVKRGARLGLYVAVVLYFAMVPFLYYAAWTSPSAREDIVGANRSTLSHLSGIVSSFCMTAFICAFVGGTVMGAVALMRRFRKA